MVVLSANHLVGVLPQISDSCHSSCSSVIMTFGRLDDFVGIEYKLSIIEVAVGVPNMSVR